MSAEDEWILTNRRGGYALGCRDSVNRRKYHGLLVAASASGERRHLVSAVEERFELGKSHVYLDANDYGDVVYPRGNEIIRRAWLRPYPAFLYEAELPRPQGSRKSSAPPFVSILKEILMDGEENAVLLRYTNLSSREVRYALRVKFSLRDHHHLNGPGSISPFSFGFSISEAADNAHPNETGRKNAVRWKTGAVSCGEPSVKMSVNGGVLRKDPMIFRNILYSWEAARGYDCREDTFAPFLHTGALKRDASVEVLFFDSGGEPELDVLRDTIISRYEALPRISTHPQALRKPGGRITYRRAGNAGTPQSTPQLSMKDYFRLLSTLLDDFRTEDNVVAGYPWFSCWGRDTMISLKAFMLMDGNPDYAFRVLRNYGRLIRNGLLPNVIGEGGQGTNYDTVDAPLWYVLRAFELFPDVPVEARKELFQYASRIVLNYRYNADLPFRCDPEDHLIVIDDDAPRALTWMDAKVDGTPVTARYGKPIEIGALWYNAVTCLARMATDLGINTIAEEGYSIARNGLHALSRSLSAAMGKYYVDRIWCDRIFRAMPVLEIRPNFVIALSLPFDFADKSRLRAAVKCARSHLLTPYGLRSLSPDSPRYKAAYRGTQAERDSAYHQGTAWTWLLMPYAQLLAKTILHEKQLKGELTELVEPFRRRLRRDRFASVAEIWDGGIPGPGTPGGGIPGAAAEEIPRGAPAQAWSAAALVVAEKMIQNL